MEDLLNSALLLLGNTALALLALGLGWLTKWIATKVHNEKAAGIIMRLDDTAMKVVREVEAAYVAALEEANADGVLTDEEKATAKAKAVAALKSYMGEKGLKELGKLLDIGGALDGFLSATIENAVAASTNIGTASGTVAPVNPI